LFRDTPVRYLGYANEIGESFRYQYPKYVVPSYIVAFGYCLADAISTGYHSYNSTKLNPSSQLNNTIEGQNSSNSSRQQEQQLRRAVIATLDTLLWQTLASVMIPGYVIHTIVKVTKYSISPSVVPKQIKVPLMVVTWLPTAIGLGAIPFIVHPIDHSVDYILNNTTRTFFKAS
jgi:mitochondrial fission process protein 1